MSGAVTEEQDIHHAQHLDLIYSQVGTLYNNIPHAMWSSNENLQLAPRHHADGVVGSASSTVATQLVGQFSQMMLSDNPTNVAPIKTSTTSSGQSSEVNYVQTTAPKTSQQPGVKKKSNNNCRKKIYSTEPTRQTNQEPNVGGSKSKRNFK